jgi:hypothetical protein
MAINEELEKGRTWEWIIYDLFNDAVSSSDYTAWNCQDNF